MLAREGPEKNVVLVCVNSDSGERVFSWQKDNLSDPIRGEELDKEYITSADFLLLDGTYPEAASQAAKWMREAGKTVMLDGSKTNEPLSDSIKKLVPLVDVLICGSGFSYMLTGIENIFAAGRAVLNLGPSIFVQTEGEKGSYTVTEDERFHVPAFDVDIVDTTGAGDVFHGAFLIGLLKRWDVKSISVFSTAVSALKCMKLGGRRSIPEYKEVEAFLEARGLVLDSI
jgi:sugar/nucleoside kinase (ribokinase family)